MQRGPLWGPLKRGGWLSEYRGTSPDPSAGSISASPLQVSPPPLRNKCSAAYHYLSCIG